MHDRLVFRSGWGKRTFGWLVFVAGLAALAAIVYGIVTHWETLDAAELWSAFGIALFVGACMAIGIVIQDMHWRIDGDVVSLHLSLRKREVRVADLGGFGKTVIAANLISFAHVDLYDRDLKPVMRLPIGFKDMPRAEAWFSQRLRYVIDDGSIAFPKRRFADVSDDLIA